MDGWRVGCSLYLMGMSLRRYTILCPATNAEAQYSAAADWVERNASAMPSDVRELFADIPDGYSCPRAWMSWCPN